MAIRKPKSKASSKRAATPNNAKSTKTSKKAAAKPASTRAPRQDYGWRKGAKIVLNKDADEKKYRGKRAEYFAILKKCNNKTVETFVGKCPDGDPPRGWLRFFVTDGACELVGGEEQKAA